MVTLSERWIRALCRARIAGADFGGDDIIAERVFSTSVCSRASWKNTLSMNNSLPPDVRRGGREPRHIDRGRGRKYDRCEVG